MEGLIKVCYTVMCKNDVNIELKLFDLLANEKVVKIIKSEFAKGFRNLALTGKEDTDIYKKSITIVRKVEQKLERELPIFYVDKTFKETDREIISNVKINNNKLEINYRIDDENKQTSINFPIRLKGDRQINTGDWDMTIQGVISGSGSLTKTHGRDYVRGSFDGRVYRGDLYLTHVNTYTGETNVTGGALILKNDTASNIIPNSPSIRLFYNAVMKVSDLKDGTFALASGQTLCGTGKLMGKTVASSGATISPGFKGPGIFNQLGDITMRKGASLAIELGGKKSGEYDALAVTGTVNLGGATLHLAPYKKYAPKAGDVYVIVNNDGDDAVVGTLVSGVGSRLATGTALPEGADVGVDFLDKGLTARISYKGGDGNDVVLTVVPKS